MSEDKQEIARLTAENLQLVSEVDELSTANTLLRDQIKGLIATNGTEEESNHE